MAASVVKVQDEIPSGFSLKCEGGAADRRGMVVATPVSLHALIEHLERLDAAAVIALAEQAIADGRTITSVVESLLLPAWEQLEHRAAEGDLDRSTVSAAASIARRALARVVLAAGPPDLRSDHAPVLVVGSAAGPDLLGADIVGEIISATGRPVQVVTGASVIEEVAAHLRVRRPSAVAITLTGTDCLPLAARITACAHGAGVPVIAWGPAFGPDDLRAGRLGIDARAPSLDVVTSTLAAWAERSPVLVAPVAESPGYAELEKDRAALLGAAAQIGGAEGDASAWAQRTASSVVSHLAAAVLVSDSRILAEHLRFVRQGLARNQLLDVHLLGLVDSLAGALSERTEPAYAYVLAARDELRRALISSRPRGERDRPAVASPGRPARSLVVSALPTAAPAPPEASGAGGGAGQVFADILLLAALSCQTPLALVSVPQGQGQWSTLSYGFERRDGLNDPALFDFVSGRQEPIEISDLTAFPGLSGSALAVAPHSLRWIYATPLRGSSGSVLGVVAVLDRWLREVSRREQRAMLAVGRQMVNHLTQLRKMPAPASNGADRRGWAPPSPTEGRSGAGSDGIVGLRRGAPLPEGQQLLRSHEVAVLFDVTERTVINWAAAGKLPSLRTIGGHLRFRSDDVLALLAGRTSGARPAAGR